MTSSQVVLPADSARGAAAGKRVALRLRVTGTRGAIQA